jgi:hypothetical protein
MSDVKLERQLVNGKATSGIEGKQTFTEGDWNTTLSRHRTFNIHQRRKREETGD